MLTVNLDYPNSTVEVRSCLCDCLVDICAKKQWIEAIDGSFESLMVAVEPRRTYHMLGNSHPCWTGAGSPLDGEGAGSLLGSPFLFPNLWYVPLCKPLCNAHMSMPMEARSVCKRFLFVFDGITEPIFITFCTAVEMLLFRKSLF